MLNLLTVLNRCCVRDFKIAYASEKRLKVYFTTEQKFLAGEWIPMCLTKKVRENTIVRATCVHKMCDVTFYRIQVRDVANC